MQDKGLGLMGGHGFRVYRAKGMGFEGPKIWGLWGQGVGVDGVQGFRVLRGPGIWGLWGQEFGLYRAKGLGSVRSGGWGL